MAAEIRQVGRTCGSDSAPARSAPHSSSPAPRPGLDRYPAILANLATGNPVLVKPHPRSVLATARAVA
ncbi:hypothetical protein GS504_00235 [Rhodococcus hoagii]|nr:hypothetical protein [Prescottella equi]